MVNQNKSVEFPSISIWKKWLTGKIRPDWAKELDVYETELLLKKQGKIEDKVFAETRLRRGVYGQRYDNGKRHDGKEERIIPYPNRGQISKGPNAEWDAPGMERIKIPWGGLNASQMEMLADLSEEYSNGVCHITTRQDVQFHFVSIDDTPTLFRRLASVGITTKEAAGNIVRNVTACPFSGVCPGEAFDCTPYADALCWFFLGHPDTQDFGRKFKISFSGCKDASCGLALMHDLGLIAVKKEVDGKEKRGFEYYVGGGLGPVPYQAKLFDSFVPEEELLPLAQAVFRVFGRYGEKKKRNRARIKFLVQDWGIDKFRDVVLQERKQLTHDSRWTEFLASVNQFEQSIIPQGPGVCVSHSEEGEYGLWLKTSVKAQKQDGYYTHVIALPLGDISANQMRALAGLARQFSRGQVRTAVEQNIVMRWIRGDDLPKLYDALKKINLADPVANSIADVTSCPGTDTCRLGLSASRGLGLEIRRRLSKKVFSLDEAVRGLHIKISGCFNSCSQHHIADIGFYGVSRKVGEYVVPHFQLVIGGQCQKNAGAYGMAITTIPSKSVPEAVERLIDLYLKGRNQNELFQDYIKRLGKVPLKEALVDLIKIPSYAEDKSYYTDWGDVREYTTSDVGQGECAGEVISVVDMELKIADREMFDAQVLYEANKLEEAVQKALQAMVTAAKGLIKGQNKDVAEDLQSVTREFKKRFCETEIFFDPCAGNKFANCFFKAVEEGHRGLSQERVFQRLEEAQLFIDAAHGCHVRMSL